ncbi:MAG: hypothetical protein JNL16_13900 [Dechloromonas sp.]|nr:hypothetical protein [Dechloromonas sp.]
MADGVANVALPTLGAALDASVAESQWVSGLPARMDAYSPLMQAVFSVASIAAALAPLRDWVPAAQTGWAMGLLGQWRLYAASGSAWRL